MKSIQPLLYETTSEDYPDYTEERYLEYELDKNRWIVTGTCFPVLFKKGFYFLIAKHCINEKSYLAKDPTRLAYKYPDKSELITAKRTVVSRSIGDEELYKDLYAFYPDKGIDTSKFNAFDLTISPP
ncbi:hypothetical protein [Ignatzschineria cameli]|uniref:Uncharacterized protein n=1 Tax=Ignatzschineria cameli TaxID=2182793 RepID=A0A2U2AQM1_9GAMM|nr:hypothetical protein [Ignatzschineria cameli]PWD86186.1 hypothetical protein DC077_05435 [Ignatzschineria cameli]